MKQNLDLVKFNLTKQMAKDLIEFNNLKKELIKLKEIDNLTNKKNKEIKKLEEQLNIIKIKFIKEFRENNKEEIIKYLEIKDQF